jgi:dolichol-phosphate mannosyltransferase
MFCLVGGLGMFVDLLVITIGVELVGLWFGWARLVGFLAAVSFNFALNDRFTFGGEGKAILPIRYMRFLLTCSAGMLVNYGVSMWLFLGFEFFTSYYLLAAVAGVIAGTAVNFAGSKWFAFRASDVAER